jgi:hypothetical protein
MALRDVFKKAAGLIVEIPDEGPALPSRPAMQEAEKAFDELGRLAARSKQQAASSSRPPNPAKTTVKTKTVEDIVRESPGPNLDEIKPAGAAKPPAITPEGTLDFQAIYQQSSVPSVQFTAEQLLDMLESLPKELPVDTKRQMVKVSLDAMGKAIGASPESIVADASRKLAALTGFVESLSTQTDQFVSSTQMEIATLQAQISEKTKAIESARQKVKQVEEGCESEADRLDDVLEFFSLDIPPSKYAPPETKSGAGK